MLILVSVGIIMVYSASFAIAGERFRDAYHFLKKQAVAAGLGMGSWSWRSKLDYHRWKIWRFLSWSLAESCLGLLIFPGLRQEIGGSARWLKFSFCLSSRGNWPNSPGHLHLARSLAKKEGRMKSFDRGVLPHFIVLGGLFVLVLNNRILGRVFCS